MKLLLRKTESLSSWWRQCDTRIFLWAITHSDISECRVIPVLPNLKITTWRNGVGDPYINVRLRLHIPRIVFDLSTTVIDDFAKDKGIEPDRYFLPF